MKYANEEMVAEQQNNQILNALKDIDNNENQAQIKAARGEYLNIARTLGQGWVGAGQISGKILGERSANLNLKNELKMLLKDEYIPDPPEYQDTNSIEAFLGNKQREVQMLELAQKDKSWFGFNNSKIPDSQRGQAQKIQLQKEIQDLESNQKYNKAAGEPDYSLLESVLDSQIEQMKKYLRNQEDLS